MTDAIHSYSTFDAAPKPEYCLHCGKKLQGYDERNRGFCCRGCESVYQILHQFGLEYYYTLRPSDPENPANISSDKFEYLSDRNFFAEYVESVDSSTYRIEFYLEGIHCAACVWLIEQLPSVVPGAISARVDFIRSRATVTFTDSTTVPAVARTLASFGYTPHPLRPGESTARIRAADRVFALRMGIAAFGALNIMLLFVCRYAGLFTGIDAQFNSLIAWVSLVLALPVVLFAALPFYRTAIGGLRVGRLHIDLPLSVAVLGGFVASVVNTVRGHSDVYFDTVTALIFLLLVGRWFQRKAIDRADVRASIERTLVPLKAEKVEDGRRTSAFVASLSAGDFVLVGTGDVVPVDGIVRDTFATIDRSILTGESEPISLVHGNEVLAGTRNVGEPFTVEVIRIGSDTRIGKIVAELEYSAERRDPVRQITDRIGEWFSVAVFLLTVITIVFWSDYGFWITFDRVMALLVVSCPCAVGIAAPIVLNLAFARAARRGMILRGGDVIERAATVEMICFDKTGTLTEGKPEVIDFWIESSCTIDEAIEYLVALEHGENHPIGRAIRRFALECRTGDASLVTKVGSEPGKGVWGVTDSGTVIRVGSFDWLQSEGVLFSSDLVLRAKMVQQDGCTTVPLTVDRVPVAVLIIQDKVKPEAHSVIEQLRKDEVNIQLLSGDSCLVSKSVAKKIGIYPDRVFGGLTPEAKGDMVKNLIQSGVKCGFCGDGVNDALALKSSYLGVAVRGGVNTVVEVADVFFTTTSLFGVIELVRGSRRTVRLLYAMFGLSVVYNIVAIILAMSGNIGPLGAALIMPASSLTVILFASWMPTFCSDAQGRSEG